MTGCPPCKVILNNETNECAKAAVGLREFILEYVDDEEVQDELLYELASEEQAFIKGVRRVAAKFSTAIGAPPRWQALHYDLAGLPMRGAPGAPSEED